LVNGYARYRCRLNATSRSGFNGIVRCTTVRRLIAITPTAAFVTHDLNVVTASHELFGKPYGKVLGSTPSGVKMLNHQSYFHILRASMACSTAALTISTVIPRMQR
jgi:hypothetical protein